MKSFITTLETSPPYDFDLTASYATYFRGDYGTDSFRNSTFRRLLDIRNRPCLACVRSLGTLDSPLLEMELQGPALDRKVVQEAQQQVGWLLGVDQDVTPFYERAFGDPVLAALVQGLRGLHVPQTVSVYEALVLAILGQQISSHVARTLRTLLIQTYGPSLEVSGIAYHAFPRPESLAAAGVERLRSIKVSARKAEYIVDISSRAASGDLDLEGLRTSTDEQVISVLTGIRGVGSWTAQWLLIRALGRTDAFPHLDLALRRALATLVKDDKLLDPQAALTYSRRWSPFRSCVTAYLFAAIRSGRFSES